MNKDQLREFIDFFAKNELFEFFKKDCSKALNKEILIKLSDFCQRNNKYFRKVSFEKDKDEFVVSFNCVDEVVRYNYRFSKKK